MSAPAQRNASWLIHRLIDLILVLKTELDVFPAPRDRNIILQEIAALQAAIAQIRHIYHQGNPHRAVEIIITASNPEIR
jgi:hypothetical protein